MKKLVLLAAATAALRLHLDAGADGRGRLSGRLIALAAIERGDWATAERLLTDDRRIAADDPARLVNLGRVYMATGRQDLASTPGGARSLHRRSKSRRSAAG